MPVYPGGQARGDTPPDSIPTIGAGGKPQQSENRAKEDNKGCPFWRDDDMIFPPREHSMSLDVLQPKDCPKGPQKYTKDYCFSLMTEDLFRAQPMLAHPTTGNGAPVPWKFLEKPPLEDVPRSRAKTHYPPVGYGRPRDLGLTTSDIAGATPRQSGMNISGRGRSDRPVDPTSPVYNMPHSPAERPPSAKGSGRNSLDISDIEGSGSAPAVPLRNQYGDTMRVEDEFKSRRHAVALADCRARSFGLAPPMDGATPRHTAGTPRLEGPKRSQRSSDPLDPSYRVPLAKDAPGTSLCCTWTEERTRQTAEPVTETSEIGRIPGSLPNAHVRDNGQPFLSLECRDIAGAAPQRRVGFAPIHVYGPRGSRREYDASLDTRDIKGATADTLARYPKVSCQNSARSYADSEPPSARGTLRSHPGKL